MGNCMSHGTPSTVRLLDLSDQEPNGFPMNHNGQAILWTDRHLYPGDTTTASDTRNCSMPLRNRVPSVEAVPPLISPTLPFSIRNLATSPYFGQEDNPVQEHLFRPPSSDSERVSLTEGPWIEIV
jgi:hypothetical protein